ncbi:hypothetical protein AXA44_36445 [Rhodococcus sp. SC4]|nr:hypothetical protein AXA44_36445 [Rhodococcus sp. SC4]
MTVDQTAVTLVHLQPDIVEADGAFGGVFAAEAARCRIIESTNDFARAARAVGVTVVFLRIAFAEDSSDLDANMPLLQMVTDMGALKDGTAAADIVSAITIDESDIILTHVRPGPFTGSALHEELTQRGITSVAVAGVATNASVEATVRQAADLGYHCTVLGDLCSAADPAAHEASLASMALFATVSESSRFLEALAPA